MIVEGLIMMLVALALTCATPAVRQLDARRHLRPPIAQPLEQAFGALPQPAPALDRLVAEAEAAIERDDLTRGIRGLRDLYDRA